MTLEERAKNYAKEFPKYPPVVVSHGWLYGIWMIGNNYSSKAKYYGEYPPSYLRRIHALFPDAKEILHLFSIRYDIAGVRLGPGRSEVTPLEKMASAWHYPCKPLR